MEDTTDYKEVAEAIFSDLNEKYEILVENELPLHGKALIDVAGVIVDRIAEGKVSSVLLSVGLKQGMAAVFTFGNNNSLELIGLAGTSFLGVHAAAPSMHMGKPK